MMILYPDRQDWSNGYIAITIAPLVFPGTFVFTLLGVFNGHIDGIGILSLFVVALLTKYTYGRLNKYYTNRANKKTRNNRYHHIPRS